MEVTKDMLIGEILKKDQTIAAILMASGMHCVGCPGSLTLCLPLDFHNPLHYSPLRLIFLSNFYFFSVLFCTLVI